MAKVRHGQFDYGRCSDGKVVSARAPERRDGGAIEAHGTSNLPAGDPSFDHEHELVWPIRKLCMGFPATQERLSHGEPSWFVGGKRMFLSFADHHHDDRVAFWAAAQDGVQRHLLEDQPADFFAPAYVGARGWIGMWLDRPGLEWDRVELLVDEAWRCIAGPRLVKAYDIQR